MKLSRTQNAKRNIIWGFVEKIVAILLPFICRTVMIKTLGAEYIGLNSLMTSILSVLSITELGFGSAIVFSMYKPIAENDEKKLCALLNLYKKIYHYIGLIILVLGLSIIPILPKLIKGTHPADVNLYILYIVYLFNTVVSYFLYSYKASLFTAHQRNDILSKRNSIITFLSNTLQIICLVLFNNYYIYVIIVPIATITTNLINAYYAKKIYPNIFCEGDITQEEKNDIKKRVSGLISYKIYNVIFTTVDTIVISSFLGLKELAIYNNYYYIQNSIVGFLVILTNSITAGIGNKLITNTKEENYADFKKFSFAKGWICSWCAVCLACLYQHFMKLWAGEEMTFSFITMILMTLYFFIPRITSMTYTYREAAGLWWEDRARPLVATVINLTINLATVKIIGTNGVLLSTIICSLFINFPWGTHILFKHCFKISEKEYMIKMCYYIIVTAFATTITLIICNLLPGTGIITMIVKLLICVPVPNAIFYAFYFKLQEFEKSKELLKNLISRKETKK